MLKLRDYSIAKKITVMNVLVSATALLLACAGFVFYDVIVYRQNVTLNLSSQAELIGANTVTAMLFNDPAAAQNTLAPLSSAPTVIYAGIYTLDGKPFASYLRGRAGAALPLPSLPPDNEDISWFEGGEIGLIRTIVFQGKPVEIVYVRASQSVLNQRLQRYGLITVLVLLGSFLASLFVSSIFKHAVAEPITRLASLASIVSREKKYSLRATPTGSQDEVAVLIAAFNDMLSQIQQRDSALQQAYDDLETRVQERTAALKSAEESLRILSGRLMETQDEERRRIARELHDSTGQSLVGLTLNLSAVSVESEKISPPAKKALEASLNLAQEVTKELRTMSYLLHPPLLDEAGLNAAVRWLIDGFSERSGILATLDLPRDLGRLPRDIETTIFRIVQECLTNIHRHSGSPSAHVEVRREGHEVRVEVRDRGKGMPAENDSHSGEGKRTGVGIQGMQERVKRLGGSLAIESGREGTTVIALLPGENTVESDNPVV